MLHTEGVNVSQDKLGIIVSLVSGSSFGTLAIFAKLSYSGGANIPTALFLRFVCAALIFWMYFLLKGEKIKYERTVIVKLLMMGALGYGSMSAFFLLSASRIPASLTGMLLYLYPAMVTVVSVMLKEERFNLHKGLALTASFVGMLFVLGVSFENSDALGIIYGLCAPCVYTAYIVMGSRVVKNLEPLKATMYIMTGAAIAYTVFGLFSGTLSFVFSSFTWFMIAGIILISTIMAVVSFWWGVKLVGPSRASIISTVEPLVTVVLAWLVFGEVLTGIQLFGGGLIMLGVIIQQQTETVRQ